MSSLERVAACGDVWQRVAACGGVWQRVAGQEHITIYDVLVCICEKFAGLTLLIVLDINSILLNTLKVAKLWPSVASLGLPLAALAFHTRKVGDYQNGSSCMRFSLNLHPRDYLA